MVLRSSRGRPLNAPTAFIHPSYRRCAQTRHNEITDKHNVLVRQVDQICVSLGLTRSTNGEQNGHLLNVTSGLPFSTIYVASSAALTLPTFFAEWTVPAGMNKTSPALRVTGGLPLSRYSSEPSMT
jgi:hypothetical protein